MDRLICLGFGTKWVRFGVPTVSRICMLEEQVHIHPADTGTIGRVTVWVRSGVLPLTEALASPEAVEQWCAGRLWQEPQAEPRYLALRIWQARDMEPPGVMRFMCEMLSAKDFEQE